LDKLKLLLKILFFVLALFEANICEAKVVVFGTVVSETRINCEVNLAECKNEVVVISENDFNITCKSERDLVSYRNLAKGCEATATKGGSSIFSHITPKIVKQMGGRGWNKELIHGTVNSPFITRVATNRATGNAATAFFTKEGGYVVRDNVTGQIIQVSNRLDPKWIPDATIINPYIPK
jgi:hypothetical protein